MRLTPSDLAVLATVLSAGPMHGYDLAQKLADSDVEDWAPASRPQIYYSLKKLAAGGFLMARVGEGRSKGPDRVVYAPTEAAEAALRDALAGPGWVKRDPPAPFTTWTALAVCADRETVKQQIGARREVLDQEIAREARSLADLEGASGRDAAVARVMIKTAVERMKVERRHLDDLERVLLEKD